MNHQFISFEGSKTLLLEKFKSYFPTIRYIKDLDVFFYAHPKSGIWKVARNLILKKTIKIELSKKIYDEFQVQISNDEENTYIRDMFLLKGKVDKMVKLLQSSKHVEILINELKNQIFINDLSHFNADPNLILFKNDVVIDLTSKKVVNVHWTDMIANNQQLNVSFEPEDDDKIATLANVFNEIIACNESRENFVKLLFESLSGFKSKRFMLNLGGNYKTIIMDIFVNILGTYGIRTSAEITKPFKFFEKIDWDTFKQLRAVVFDVETLNEMQIRKNLINNREFDCNYGYRHLYEPSNDVSPFRATFFVNCDQFIVKTMDYIDYAMENRMLKTQFRTDTDVKFEVLFNDKFVTEYGMQFIHYLFKFCD